MIQGKLNTDFEGMGFDFVTLSMRQGGHLNISEQYLTTVKHIDSTVNQYPLNQAGDELLLQHLVDLMPAFKQLLDNCDKVELDYLYLQYPGFHRLGAILEAMAIGIQNGDIEVPKDH